MKVKELITKLEMLNPDSTVVLNGFDHSYFPLSYVNEIVMWTHNNGHISAVPPEAGDAKYTEQEGVVIE